MSDTPKEVIEQVISSQNFVMIIIGALVWLIGLYIPIIGPLIVVCGFGLTTIATIQAAMMKPVTSAFPGLLLGGLIQVIGYYLAWVLFLGLLSPLFIVAGGVLILFYGSSLALQRADIPIVKNIEGFIDSRKKKEAPKKAEEEEVVDVEEETTEESDTTEQ